MIPRDVPAPRPTANDRTHRLDAEAEAWMQKWAGDLIRAWERDGTFGFSPELEAEVRQFWPELWTRWRTLMQAKDRLSSLIANEKARRGL